MGMAALVTMPVLDPTRMMLRNWMMLRNCSMIIPITQFVLMPVIMVIVATHDRRSLENDRRSAVHVLGLRTIGVRVRVVSRSIRMATIKTCLKSDRSNHENHCF